MFRRFAAISLILVGSFLISGTPFYAQPVNAQADLDNPNFCLHDTDCDDSELCRKLDKCTRFCVNNLCQDEEGTEEEVEGEVFEEEEFDNSAERAKEARAARASLKRKVKNLDPLKTSPQILIGRILKTALGLSGTIALVMILYSGVVWMLARGKSDIASQAKDTILWAVFGLAIIFASYAIVDFVIKAVQVQ